MDDDYVLTIASEMASEFEGLSLEPYHDPVGYPTIGYGHLLARERNADLDRWSPISEEEAIALLEQDMAEAMQSVQRLIYTEDLNDNQIAAICDFTLNLGSGNLQASTLRRVINRGDLKEVPRQLKRWVWAGGVKLKGLVRRRSSEADLFLL